MRHYRCTRRIPFIRLTRGWVESRQCKESATVAFSLRWESGRRQFIRTCEAHGSEVEGTLSALVRTGQVKIVSSTL